MIVSCPDCSARYKINEGKIKGRGAKITCPRCTHPFVVYRPGMEPGPPIPEGVADLDFATLGVTWRSRTGMGTRGPGFTSLQELVDHLQVGHLNRWDRISPDGIAWVAVEAIDDLQSHFWEVWQRAQRGEIATAPLPEGAFGVYRRREEEDESEMPTTIVGRDSDLANEIREAVARPSLPPFTPGESFRTEDADDDYSTADGGLNPEVATTASFPPQRVDASDTAAAVLGGSDSGTGPAPLSTPRGKRAGATPPQRPSRTASPTEPEPESSWVLITIGLALSAVVLGMLVLGGVWLLGELNAAAPDEEPRADEADQDPPAHTRQPKAPAPGQVIEPQPAPRVEPQPAPRVEPQPAPRVEPQPAPEVEPQPAPEVEPQPAPGVEPQPAPGVEPQPAPEVEPQPAPEIEPQPDPGVEPQPAPEVEPQPAPEVEPQPAPEVEPQPAPEVEPQPAPEVETRPDPLVVPVEVPEPTPAPQPSPPTDPETAAP